MNRLHDNDAKMFAVLHQREARRILRRKDAGIDELFQASELIRQAVILNPCEATRSSIPDDMFAIESLICIHERKQPNFDELISAFSSHLRTVDNDDGGHDGGDGRDSWMQAPETISNPTKNQKDFMTREREENPAKKSSQSFFDRLLLWLFLIYNFILELFLTMYHYTTMVWNSPPMAKFRRWCQQSWRKFMSGYRDYCDQNGDPFERLYKLISDLFVQISIFAEVVRSKFSRKDGVESGGEDVGSASRESRDKRNTTEHDGPKHSILNSKYIPIPTEPAKAIKRILQCKNDDLYEILGVPWTSDEKTLKKSYRLQSLKVHPDKTKEPGAELAFSKLSEAYSILSDADKRTAFLCAYEDDVTVRHFVNDFEDEITEYLARHEKERELNETMLGCAGCGGRHPKVRTDRTLLKGRYCSSCNTYHKVNNGDVWAETHMLFRWHFYACFEGAIYEVNQWGECQNFAKRIPANAHQIYINCSKAADSKKDSKSGKKGRSKHGKASTKEFTLPSDISFDSPEDFVRYMMEHEKDRKKPSNEFTAEQYAAQKFRKRASKKKK